MCNRGADMKTPIHLWIVGIVSLIWNAGGGYDYIMSQTENPAYFEMMPQEGIDFLASTPVWFEATWAIGVWFSILGSILLLFKSRWAGSAFGVSLLGLLASSLYTYVLSDTGGSALAVGGTAALIFSIAIPLVLVLLLAYARSMTRKGVLT